jgi:hypothetical protein
LFIGFVEFVGFIELLDRETLMGVIPKSSRSRATVVNTINTKNLMNLTTHKTVARFYAPCLSDIFSNICVSPAPSV